MTAEQEKAIKVVKILEAALADIAAGAVAPAPLARQALAHARKVAQS